MDGITHCKLKKDTPRKNTPRKNTPRKLLEFFVLELTARSAADFLEIQPNTAALFYKKIRQIVAYHLAIQEQEMFDGKIELNESYFGGHRKGKEGVARPAKFLFLGFRNEQAKSMLFLYQMPELQRFCLS